MIFRLLLFLAISVSFYSLAFSDDGHISKCATFKPEIRKNLLTNHFRNHPILNNTEKSSILSKIQNGSDEILRFNLPVKFDSPSGRFRIHYSLFGEDAVDISDKNINGIPDYIDSVAFYFDYAYSFLIEVIGYIPPPPDNGNGGSDAYDIYVLELGKSNGLYGYTSPEEEILPRKKFERWTSYIAIDNNYSSNDSAKIDELRKIRTYTTTGIDGLKITAVHEFHHAIQFTYGMPEPPVNSLNEMTSTWLEYRAYPEIKDYYQYLPSLFNGLQRYPFASPDGANGYRWSIFGQYMYKKYSDEPMRRMWELIADGNDAWGALDKAFREKNSSLAQEWCSFHDWMYYTGNRAKGSSYFDDAALFPTIKHFCDTIITHGSFDNAGSLLPYEIRTCRYIFRGEGERSDDTLELIFSNTDTESARKILNLPQEYLFTFSESSFQGSEPIDGTIYNYRTDYPQSIICLDSKLYNGIMTCTEKNVYPNPFINHLHSDLSFPVPNNVYLYEKAKLTVYDAEMRVVHSSEEIVGINNSCRVLKWQNIKSKFTSGIYIYLIEHSKGESWGKFSVRQ